MLATFQMMMNKIFKDLINSNQVFIYIDNIIVATETEDGHDEIVMEILKRLEENNLFFLKLEKCVWKVREVGVLGVVIGLEGVKIEEEKVEGILEWPVPQNVRDVQSFMGLANYYQ